MPTLSDQNCLFISNWYHTDSHQLIQLKFLCRIILLNCSTSLNAYSCITTVEASRRWSIAVDRFLTIAYANLWKQSYRTTALQPLKIGNLLNDKASGKISKLCVTDFLIIFPTLSTVSIKSDRVMTACNAWISKETECAWVTFVPSGPTLQKNQQNIIPFDN